ncbi:MAG: cadmium-translocating P-type ATPase [Sulfitobacter sp.]|nr:cadmium-translocating P-type ATPase [Sulfitobacter sp.]
MAAATTLTFPVQNMTCGGCAARVTRVLQGIEGAEEVNVNFATGTAYLKLAEGPGTQRLIQNLAEAGYPAKSEQVTLALDGMSCASCVGRVNAALEAAPGVLRAQANLATNTAEVSFVPGITTPETLAGIVTKAGYPARILTTDNGADLAADRAAEGLHQRNLMLLSAAMTLPVFILEMGAHLIPAWHHLIIATIGMQASWIVQFVLTTAVLIGPGRGFFSGGIAAMRAGAPNMNTLVALGAGAAWAYSTTVLFAPGLLPEGARVVYFEAAAVIVTLILLGRWFEARAKGQTGAAISKLIGLQPRTAQVRAGAAWVERDIAELRVGDQILVRPGEKVAIDSTVIEGESPLDESMITGEPMPVAKAPGDALTGGTVNGAGSLVAEVTRTGQDTTLSQIIRMVQQAQGARLPIQALVDRITLWFVPAVLVIALVTVAVWLIFGPEPRLSHALVAGVSVLIIACPCAMGLATPTSIMVGTGRAAQRGVLFRQGDALQALSGVEVVAFDKTGTLTLGKPALTDVSVADGFGRDDVLRAVAAVEARSEHPLGQAIVAAVAGVALPPVSEIQVTSGQGIAGTVDGLRVAIGNAKYLNGLGIDLGALAEKGQRLARTGQTVFYAAIDGQTAALLAVSDPIKPGTAEAIAALKARGLRVAMITGDGQETAEAVAAELGIDEVAAGVLPDGKIAALDALRGAGTKVAFVGDGINDAPVLAHADVGIAIGTGTDVAIETADVVLMSGEIPAVLRAFETSRATLRNIRQNLFWAFGYNTLLIPVAAGVLYPFFGLTLSPALAAGAMAFSSVFVVTNALRLRHMKDLV